MKKQTQITNTFLLSLTTTIILSLIVAFRGNTRDTHVYIDFFNSIDIFDLKSPIKFYEQSRMEYLYGLLNYIISIFFSDYKVLFFVVSFLTFYFIYKTCKFLKINYSDVLFFYLPTSYFLALQLMQIRQGLSCVIISYSIVLLISLNDKLVHNRLKSFCYCLGAYFIHSTAVVPYFIVNKFSNRYILNNKYNEIIKQIVFFIIAVVFIRFVVSLNILTEYSERISLYSEWDEFSSDRGFFDPANVRVMLIWIFFVCGGYKLRYNNFYNCLLTIYTMGFAVRIGFFDFLIISGRLGATFGIVEIFLFPMILRTLFSKSSFYILATIYFLIMSYITLAIQSPFLIEDYFSPF